SGECETDDQPRKKDWLARDPVHLNRVQGWKNVTRDASDGHGFPWADDEVGEDHHPARRKTHCARKDFCRVGHFPPSGGHSRNKFSVDVADGKKQSTTKNEAKDPAKRTATQKPVVHDNQPSNADHRAPTQREVIDDAEFSCKLRGGREGRAVPG